VLTACQIPFKSALPSAVRGALYGSAALHFALAWIFERSDPTEVQQASDALASLKMRKALVPTLWHVEIVNALMVALRYDKNAGVREQALAGLEPYVSEDVRVRDAVLEALLDDSEPRIRTMAINILEPVEADTSVRQVLSSVAYSDHNPHIRTVSRQVLSHVPEIQ